ncbi:RNA-binding protein [Photobacterium aphoticum]|uniref:RNA-binding protein n=1 Tax=Photobacterium aphoticum TaxID=754436 RepID=A0A090QR59_9GAMM|nr:RNA-binding protein [Photobacterium aphoticum]
MAYWLFKTEPDTFSIDTLKQQQVSCWEGVRNYQARNMLRDQVKVGDEVLIYHSSCKEVGVVGIATVVKEAYPDHFQFDPDSPYFDPKSDPATRVGSWSTLPISVICVACHCSG